MKKKLPINKESLRRLDLRVTRGGYELPGLRIPSRAGAGVPWLPNPLTPVLSRIP